MTTHLKIFLLVIICLISVPSFAQIYVNEVVASNGDGIQDEDGDNPDWIELYNSGSQTINLNGYGISDDTEERFQFVLPDIELPAGAYYLLYASDKNRDGSTTGYVHLNFKLSADGEIVYLTNTDTMLVDSLSYPELESDESFGRSAGSETGYFIFTESTPLAENSSQGYYARLANPEVTEEAGFYNQPVEVSLQNQNMADLTYFTTDGTDPTEASPLFGTEPRVFSQTTTLKLRAMEAGKLSSDIEVYTYFINKDHDLPVISLVTDPDYFFDQNEGIYIQYEEDIEVPVHLEFFEEDGSVGFKSHVGTKIYGSYSRRFDLKSLSVFFRGEYGLSELEYPLFEETEVDKFESFVLRNAGNDFGSAHMRDAAMTTIIENDVDIDYQAYRPSVVYLNGEYWGILNIREKINEHFIASHHDVDEDDIDLIEATEDPEAKNGTVDLYLEFLEEVENADMTNQEEYEEVTRQIDLENYIDYMAIEIFYANTDWPGTNMKLWRDRNEGGKWRWILYDTDHGFNLYSGEGDYNLDMFEHTMQTNPNLLKYSNPLWATMTFRKLMENEGFKKQFLTRLSGLMNTVFQTEHMIAVVDSLAAGIESEMPAHEDRWNLTNGWTGEGPFLSQVEDMRDFARQRQTYMVQHMQTHFRLSGLQEITVDVNNSGYGTVQVNRAEPDSYPWSGSYFSDYTVQVKAVANEGFEFTGWSGAVTSTNSVVEVNPGDSLFASFASLSGASSDIVINEIMYNAPDEQDTGDWIELYNNTSSDIDISGWVVKDDDDEHAFSFPENTGIEANGYLVIADDPEAFNEFYSDVNPLYGELGFGLGGGSDQVRLYNESGSLVDSLEYDDEDPWPSDADGTGFTLELINANTDNSEAVNWNASTSQGGTPGRTNSTAVSNEEQQSGIPEVISLKQNYPNPFNPGTHITFQLSESSVIKLTIFDMLGRQVKVLDRGRRSAGVYSLYWDATQQASGMYIYRLEAGGEVFTKKMLLIK